MKQKNEVTTIEQLDYMLIRRQFLHEYSEDQIIAFCKNSSPLGFEAKDEQNNNLLQLGIKTHCGNTMEFLIKHGVNINHVNNDGDTALSIAVKQHGVKSCMLYEVLFLLNHEKTLMDKPIRVNNTLLDSKQKVLSYFLFDAVQRDELGDVRDILRCSDNQGILEGNPHFKFEVVNMLNSQGLAVLDTLTTEQSFRESLLNVLYAAGAITDSFKKAFDCTTQMYDPTFFKNNEEKISGMKKQHDVESTSNRSFI
jgi:hypothetical protein